MSKHNQSAALGQLSDFSQRTPAPDREVPDRDIEARVANFERAVNEILHQLADFSKQLDQPGRNQVLPTPPKQASTQHKKRAQPKQHPQPNLQEKPKSAPKPKPQAEPMSEEQIATLSDAIHELLLDGTPRTKTEICKSAGCSKSEYALAREHLIATDRMQGGDGNDIVAGKICNVPGGFSHLDAVADRCRTPKTHAKRNGCVK